MLIDRVVDNFLNFVILIGLGVSGVPVLIREGFTRLSQYIDLFFSWNQSQLTITDIFADV